jgi:hypothetical protein
MESKAKLWAARIDEWKRSGVSQPQYCEDNHLALATFSWWRKRLKQQRSRSGDAFVEIPVERALSTRGGRGGSLSIGIGHYTVTVHGSVDHSQLEDVLTVLEQR